MIFKKYAKKNMERCILHLSIFHNLSIIQGFNYLASHPSALAPSTAASLSFNSESNKRVLPL